MACPPTVLIQKCRFCNFQAVFGHFAQNVPQQSTPFDFIDDVSVKALLGKNNHSIIEVVLQNHLSLPSYTEMWDYSKADFKKMKALFNEKFNTCIKNFTDVGSQYTIFHSTLNQAKKDFIPKKVLKLIYTITMSN